jgi:hypothetical protein
MTVELEKMASTLNNNEDNQNLRILEFRVPSKAQLVSYLELALLTSSLPVCFFFGKFLRFDILDLFEIFEIFEI